MLQGNLQHREEAMSNLRQYLTAGKSDFALILEPYIIGNKIVGLNNDAGTIFVAPKANKPRSCIFVNKKYDAILVPKLSNRDLTVVYVDRNLKGANHPIMVAAAYLPYEHPERTEHCTTAVKQLIDHCRLEKIDLIIGFDANAHHIVWGSTDTNQRGESLLEYLSTTDLRILNRGNKPTFVIKNRQEVIDITTSTPGLADQISNWHVSDDLSVSDHKWIRFDVTADEVEPKWYRDPRRTNWDLFQEKLLDNLVYDRGEPQTQEEVEEALGKLEAHLLEAFSIACPLRRTFANRSKFWSKKLEKLRKSSRKLFNRAQRTKSSADWYDYKISLKRYKKTLRAAKRKAWLKFCDEVKDLKATAKLHKALAKDPFCPEMLKKEDGTYTKSNEEVVECLMNAHFPGTRSVEQAEQQPVRVPNAVDWEISEAIVTESRLKWAIDSFKPYKSAGKDGIYPIVLQKASYAIIRPLKGILRAVLALGYVPKSWRDVIVLFIHKPGRTSYDLANAYRPISLTSFVMKTLERLCDRYIRDTNLKVKPLNDKQHAYQPGKSVDTALHQVVHTIEKNMGYDKLTLATFMDLEGAFNKVTFRAINRALKRFGLSRTLTRWIMAMLSNRIVTIDILGIVKLGVVDRGCPQGGVLPPLLWNMTVDDLLTRLNGSGYLAIGYADDIVILISGAFEEVISPIMRNALRIVEEWCDESGLTVNPEKTGLMLFTRKRKLRAFTRPKLLGVTLELTDKVKYLGVILDRELSWREHIQQRTKKALKVFWQCRTAFGKTWGLKPSVLYWMYRSIVRPILTYGCLVWSNKTRQKNVDNALTRVQRLACLSVTGVMTTTPTAALEILLSLTPISLFVRQEADLAAERLYRTGRWIAQSSEVGHAKLLADLKREFREMEMPSDYMPTKYCFDEGFRVLFPQRSDWESGTPVTGDIEVYTDGSKADGNAGAGIYSEEMGYKVSMPLGSIATVFQSEVVAIDEGAALLNESGTHGKRVTICSDSEASLKALSSCKVSSKIVNRCRESLKVLSEHNEVTLIWVPGHSDVRGNEMADKLARQGSKASYIGPEPRLSTCAGLMSSLIKQKVREEHQLMWDVLETCRQAKELLSGCNMQNTKFLLSLNRKGLRDLVGILTGHNTLKYHLQKMGLTDTTVCRGCGSAAETAKHFLCHCPRLGSLRARCLGDYYLTLEEARNLKISKILSFITEAQWLNDQDVS